MKRVYYVQRLKAPREELISFSFGGGLINGGFAPNTMRMLKDIMSFDYMGSAEFEWGAVPSAFKSLFENKAIEKKVIDINGKPVYIISPSTIMPDVVEWIKEASSKYISLKERLGFQEALEGAKYNDFKGWIKIEDDRYCEEPFMFFIDEGMYNNVCKLMGI